MIIFCVYSINELSYDLIENRSKVLYDSQGNIVAYSLSSDNESYRFFTSHNEVSPLYINMLLASEDKRFYEHFGVDFISLLRALIGNIKSGEITSGGSTLAMQVAKRLTNHKRTYFNKLKEIVQAVYITQKFGRDTVLDWYLTLAPFGSNIEGVKAASLKWFNHLPNNLTPSEAALLSAFPRTPEYIRPDRNHKATIYYKNESLRLAYERGVISKDVWLNSIKEDLPNTINQIRQSAFTLSNVFFNDVNIKNKEIYTTLEPNIQKILLNEAKNFNELHKDSAVLSVVVLDSNDHKIKGLLGSSDLTRTQLCLPFSKRSPGSSLKPFAFALAYEQRKLHPKTIVHDNAKLFGTWNPKNYDRTFNGKVTSEKALTTSLNLPAIEVLELVGLNNFVNFINMGNKNSRLITKNNLIDYSIILGSGTISLIDLAQLYAMLNEDGYYNNFELLVGKSCQQSFRMLEADSARVTFEILKKTNRPMNGINLPNASYKTGTSSKFNDALAIGSYENYTVAVAIRIPNNNNNDYKYAGYKDAAPILFNIFRALDPAPYIKSPIESELFSDRPPKALVENIIEQKIIDENAIKIIFPQNGDIVVPDHNGNIFIKYSGGKGKIYINFNDQQLIQNFVNVTQEGSYKISIMDEFGHSNSVTFSVILEQK